MSQLPQIGLLRQAEPTKASASRRSGFSVPAAAVAFFAVAAILVVYGLVVCWSATSADPDYSFSRQLMGTGLGLVAMAILWRFDYRRLANMSTVLLIINVILILSPHVPGLAAAANDTWGAASWIRIGIQLQPGEFAKVTVVLFAASLVARYGGRLDDPREYIKTVILLFVPFLCIMTQPDLGTGLVYLFIAATVLLMGGAKVRYMAITAVVGIAGIIALLLADEFIFKYQTASGDWEYRILKQYQRSRLTVFLNPEADTSGDGYNLAQAMIAIGSGGLFGKGLLSGTQHAYGYLPEASTDFIFCVVGEELGFVGAMALLLLYGLLIFFALRIARQSEDLFGMLVVCGIVGMWLFQVLENVGMCCGLMPITGIPLPFVSYGSSFMITNFAMLGLIGSVCMHRSVIGRKGSYAAAR